MFESKFKFARKLVTCAFISIAISSSVRRRRDEEKWKKGKEKILTRFKIKLQNVINFFSLLKFSFGTRFSGSPHALANGECTWKREVPACDWCASSQPRGGILFAGWSISDLRWITIGFRLKEKGECLVEENFLCVLICFLRRLLEVWEVVEVFTVGQFLMLYFQNTRPEPKIRSKIPGTLLEASTRVLIRVGNVIGQPGCFFNLRQT